MKQDIIHNLFVYAFYKNDGENGVHEDLCLDATIPQGVEHAKKLWPDADTYRVSDVQIGSPYYFLFAQVRTPEEISRHIVDTSADDIAALVSHLDELNKEIS
jgi:hypothetical protein